ncbi:MAG: copper chaperone PCu(A)C [Sphingomonadaceae bacterium]|nr:copper chaperone PCu(A)C [Sphingomonadaceae bacterium]
MRSATLAMIAALALAGCGQKAEQRVDEAWVRLGATPVTPGAAYLTIHGGPTADRLLDVSSPVVIRAEMHETMASGNMASMKRIEGGVAIPAKGKVEFKPGGRHVMLFNVNPGIVPPRTLPLIFTFASGERIEVDAALRRAGDAAP